MSALKETQQQTETVKNKPYSHSPETKEKMRLAKSGRASPFLGKKHTPEARDKIRLARLGKKRNPEHAKNAAVAKVGIKLTGRAAAGPMHFNSVMCRLRSPDNAVWYVQNLAHFVRTHSYLFAPEDVVWRERLTGKNGRRRVKGCKALRGLANILPSHKNPKGSWKGWTVVGDVEYLYNGEQNLLYDNPQPQKP